jgi:hypothetical protein
MADGNDLVDASAVLARLSYAAIGGYQPNGGTEPEESGPAAPAELQHGASLLRSSSTVSNDSMSLSRSPVFHRSIAVHDSEWFIDRG